MQKKENKAAVLSIWYFAWLVLFWLMSSTEFQAELNQSHMDVRRRLNDDANFPRLSSE